MGHDVYVLSRRYRAWSHSIVINQTIVDSRGTKSSRQPFGLGVLYAPDYYLGLGGWSTPLVNEY